MRMRLTLEKAYHSGQPSHNDRQVPGNVSALVPATGPPLCGLFRSGRERHLASISAFPPVCHCFSDWLRFFADCEVLNGHASSWVAFVDPEPDRGISDQGKGVAIW